MTSIGGNHSDRTNAITAPLKEKNDTNNRNIRLLTLVINTHCKIFYIILNDANFMVFTNRSASIKVPPLATDSLVLDFTCSICIMKNKE